MIDAMLPLSGVLGSALCGCAIGWVLGRRRIGGYVTTVPDRSQVCDLLGKTPDERRRVQDVKAVLEQLRHVSRVRGHRAGDAEAAFDQMRCVLSEVLSDIASSPSVRDAEAGRLLLDYYIKRVGSHQVVMERLYLSRPTFYRRLKHGLNLVAQRLEEPAA